MTPPPSQEEQPTQGNNSNTAKRSAKDFIFGKEIGEGSFSTVYLAKDIHSQKEFAIKVCEKRHIIREKKVEYVKREKEVLNLLSDSVSYFVRLYCTFQDRDRLYFVLTYAKNGEMLQLINKIGFFDINLTKFYSAEMILALEYLNKKGIIHRDLKPENILLDDKLNILITDFGSAKIVNSNFENQEINEREKRRRNSFVGTAQYVSPEILQDGPVSFASDLWALGCIIYQMISGSPPFRAGSEYLIFQKILRLDYEFTDNFNDESKDLIKKLVVIDPKERLGALDETPYTSLREHKLFNDINWNNLGNPPHIHSYLSDVNSSLPKNQFEISDSEETGLDDRRVSKLQLESLCAGETPVEIIPNKERQGIADIDPSEIAKRLEVQKTTKWHQFVENKLILKQGLLDKKKGIRARRRMFLLTHGPRLFYVDPSAMVLKGEIPWTSELRVEARNFKNFNVITPNRTYYLEDPEGYALNWCKTIEEVHKYFYPNSSSNNSNLSSSSSNQQSNSK